MPTNAIDKESLGKEGGVYADATSGNVTNPNGTSKGFAWIQILAETQFSVLDAPNVDLDNGIDPTTITFAAGSIVAHPVMNFTVTSGTVFAAHAKVH